MFDRIAEGRTDLVLDLIAAGTPATAKDARGVSLIAWCAYHGDVAERPLHTALCKANEPIFDDIVKLLLDAGANPNVATNARVETGAFMRDVRTKGETPLHRAAAYGSERAIGLLLENGAVVDARDANGDTPLTWASWHLRPRPILRLLTFGNFTA